MDSPTVRNIIARVERLEKAVFGDRATGAKKASDASRRGLPAHILALRGKGYFKEPKTAAEVHRKLTTNYRCEPDRVAMALLRLQRRKQLRKSSKKVGKKKQVAYVW